MDGAAKEPFRRLLSQRRVVVQVADDLPAQAPEIVHMLADGFGRKARCGQVLDERPQAGDQFFPRRQVLSNPIQQRGQFARSRQ